MTISIVIPVYNSEKYLPEAIESCICQTYKDIEIVLVDDGSTDNSLSICKEYQNKDKRIKVISQENGGVSSARNRGIDEATGDLLFFLDSDDVITSTSINELVKEYKLKEQEKGIVGVRVVSFHEKDKPALSVKRPIDELMHDKLNGYVCGYLFVKEKCPKFEKVKYCEDFLFLVDYLRANCIEEIDFLPSTRGAYLYRKYNESSSNQKCNIMTRLEDASKMFGLLDKKTDGVYSELIKNKKIRRFESELQHASKNELEKITRELKLESPKKVLFRYKYFLKAYQKKDINILLRYYKIRNNISSVIRGKQ